MKIIKIEGKHVQVEMEYQIGVKTIIWLHKDMLRQYGVTKPEVGKTYE